MENHGQIPFKPRKEIEATAEKLLKEHGLTNAPIDPVKLANVLGVKVFNAKFSDDSISGLLARRGPTVTMLINASDSASRKRFTIAHEIGHKVLGHFSGDSEHADRVSDLFRFGPSGEASNDVQNAEVQANIFAASLLMPAFLIQEAWRSCKDTETLADQFMVSPEAMGYRLSTLGLS